MGKRLNESSKGKSIRSKKAGTAKAKSSRKTAAKAKTATTKTAKAAAKELSPIEAIMTMTTKDAWKYRTIFGSARSRQSPSRGKP